MSMFLVADTQGHVISSYPAYFVGGILKNRTSETIAKYKELQRVAREELEKNPPVIESSKFATRKVPFYNWLNIRE